MTGLNARILVTGASGFVGRHMLRSLSVVLPEAVVLGVGGPQEGVGGLDLLNAQAVRQTVQTFAPTDVLHLAAASSVGQTANAPLLAWDTNVVGLRNLAATLVDLGSPTRMIFPSSAEIYGRAFLAGPCDEDTVPEPASSYGRTKLAGEFLLRDLAGPSLQVVALRLFNHTGAGQDTRFVIPGFAAQIADLEQRPEGGAIRVGNLDAERDFTHIDDIIEAYMTVLQSPRTGQAFSLYNVGSGELRSIQSILNALLAMSTANITVEVDPDRLRPSEISVAQGLFSRFSTDYGWRPTRPFDRALAAVLNDQRARLLQG